MIQEHSYILLADTSDMRELGRKDHPSKPPRSNISCIEYGDHTCTMSITIIRCPVTEFFPKMVINLMYPHLKMMQQKVGTVTAQPVPTLS